MKIKEVRNRAEALGIASKSTSKAELIHAIQAAEKNPACYQTGRQECPETECCWMDDCIPKGSSQKRGENRRDSY
jgi:hypothetical protein